MDPSTLVVGMDLQFKPQMYLQNGKPAGYDVVLLNALAKQLHVKLKIENLDFNGLIPGLQSKKFDLVSVGLSPTPERRKVISFSRPYVPYAQILAAKKGDTTAGDGLGVERLEQDDHLAAGIDRGAARAEAVPEGEGRLVPGSERGVPAGRDGPCERHRGRELPARAVQQVERQQARRGGFPKPLQVQYGAYAVQKGNATLVKTLNKFICSVQGNGQLARIYQQTEGTALPPMPRC